jgi:hypothetical protein
MPSERFARSGAWFTHRCLTGVILAGFMLGVGTVTLPRVALAQTARFQKAQTEFLHPLADTASHVSYEEYSPGGCLAAVTRVGTTARRDNATGAESWSQSFLENDTVLAVERETAARCTTSADVSHVDPRELPNLARLYWFLNDTVHMNRAIDRRLALDATDSAKAVTYRQLLGRFLLQHNRDLRFVMRRIIPALDSLTSLNARVVRVEAHAALAYAFASSRSLSASDSTQAEIAAAMVSFAKIPVIVQKVMVDTVGPLFELGAAEATERGDTVLAKAMLEYARQSLSKIPEGAEYVHRTEEVVRYFGMAAPAIHADFVYGAGKDATPAGPWPRPGRWTLVSPLPNSGALGEFYRHIHTLVRDSLDIVFVAATRGSLRPHGPLTPAEEGTLLFDYLSRRWKIPGILLVEARPFHKLPDGRRVNDATLTPTLYATTGLVIDPQGTIRAMIQPSTLARFDQVLTSIMRAGVSAATK